MDLAAEQALASVLRRAADVEHLSGAHDVSDGGLVQTLAESVMRNGVGARVRLPEGLDDFVWLFSESTARAVITVPKGHEAAVRALCEEYGVPWQPLGIVDADVDGIDFDGLFDIPLAELRQAWQPTLGERFGRPAIAE